MGSKQSTEAAAEAAAVANAVLDRIIMNEYEVFESLASPSVLTEEAPLSAAEMALVAELMRKAIEHVKNVPAAE